MIPFHKLLISTGIVFCAGFAGWSFWRFGEASGGGLLALGIVFALLAAGLGYYLRNLRRFLGR
ncbi:MAG: hypothetical protein ACREN5_03265 [Gemmatimonadales bacterium]